MQNRVILRVEKKQSAPKAVPLSLRAPLHPLPSAINLSSVHSKTSIFHSNSNEDISSTVWQIWAISGKFGPKIWCPNLAQKMVLTAFWRHPGIRLLVNLMKRPAHFLLTCYSPKSTPPLWLLPPFPSPANVRISWDAPPDPLQTFPQSNLQLC